MRLWILILALAGAMTPALAGKSSPSSAQKASSAKISSSRPKPAKVAKAKKAAKTRKPPKVAKAGKPPRVPKANKPRKTAQRAKAPKPAKDRTNSARDSRSEAKRAGALRTFQKSHPCPATGLKSGACPGYVVDQIVPLTNGGVAKPSNMRWQTVAEALAQDGLQ